MNRERWAQVKAAFESALEQPAEERDECVRKICGTDSELEAEVKALLKAHESAGEFLQAPAAAVMGSDLPNGGGRTLSPGELLSRRFEILRFLNRGGMGEVYEAWDRELQEHIALKTIRPEIASSPAVLERFKHEVKRGRGISHANVCRVYDLFNHVDASGQTIWFLTMELLRGQSLAEWLRTRGPIQAEKALELVKQMAAGLAAAHELGIVHRDFKTGNVMLVQAEDKLRAVVTDFGLALSLREDHGSATPSVSGTPDYMAPEQARGEPVGIATDQFALGLVMCEILTGKRPKRAGDQVALPAEHRFSPRWAAVIRRCLQIQPQDRFASIAELISALDPQKRRGAWWIGAAASLLAVAALVIMIARSPKDRIEDAVQVTGDTDLSTDPSLSRDGKTLAYISDRAGAGRSDIWVQHLPVKGEPLRVATGASPDKFISISPDGSAVAFRSERDGGGVYLANTAGGGERLLVQGGRDPRFSPDGQRVLYWKGDQDETVPSGQLFAIAVTGGTPTRLAADFKDARYGVWSPKGDYVLFTGCKDASQPLDSCREWWVISTDGASLADTGALAVLRKQGIELLDNAVGGWYGDENTVLFGGVKEGTTSLWEMNLSQRDLRANGPAQQLTSGSNTEIDPSLAADGTVACGHLIGALHIWGIENPLSPGLAAPVRITDDTEFDSSPYVSHNGRWLAFDRQEGGRRHIEVRDLKQGSILPVAASDSDEISPVIDDSGATIVFEARDGQVPAIFARTGKAPPRKLCSGCNSPAGWFDGARAIFYHEGMPSRIKILYLDTGESRTVLEKNGFSLANADWSPENQYLLFTAATGGGNNRIFAVRMPESTGKTTGNWIPVTGESELSDRPRWSGDGKTIFYVSTRDGFHCIWGQHFDPQSGKMQGLSFEVMPYHNMRLSPVLVVWKRFGLSAGGNAIYLNPGEENETIWIGKLKRHAGAHWWTRLWQ